MSITPQILIIGSDSYHLSELTSLLQESHPSTVPKFEPIYVTSAEWHNCGTSNAQDGTRSPVQSQPQYGYDLDTRTGDNKLEESLGLYWINEFWALETGPDESRYPQRYWYPDFQIKNKQ